MCTSAAAEVLAENTPQVERQESHVEQTWRWTRNICARIKLHKASNKTVPTVFSGTSWNKFTSAVTAIGLHKKDHNLFPLLNSTHAWPVLSRMHYFPYYQNEDVVPLTMLSKMNYPVDFNAPINNSAGWVSRV